MTYTSGKTTHDPEPYVDQWGIDRNADGDPAGYDFDVQFHYAPRPEFDNHNPILVAYRRIPDIDLWDMGFAMHATYGGEREWERPDHYFHSFVVASPEQVKHARRVLTKLANIYKEA